MNLSELRLPTVGPPHIFPLLGVHRGMKESGELFKGLICSNPITLVRRGLYLGPYLTVQDPNNHLRSIALIRHCVDNLQAVGSKSACHTEGERQKQASMRGYELRGREKGTYNNKDQME